MSCAVLTAGAILLVVALYMYSTFIAGTVVRSVVVTRRPATYNWTQASIGFQHTNHVIHSDTSE